MSEHYISCARCDKDIVIKTSNDCYSSEIDGKLLCFDCWQKEQPKYLADQIVDLEEKLAEKEKEYRESVEKILSSRDKFILEYNQDKISFAVEQLRKLEESILDVSNGYWRYFMTDGAEYMLSSDLESCLEEYIDNQIEELKKGE